MALHLYLEGLGFRSIGRILKFSHVAIYFGEKASSMPVTKKQAQVVEIDIEKASCMLSHVHEGTNRAKIMELSLIL